jgi:hypothetical protein
MVALPLIGLMAVMLVAFMLINERDRQQAQSRFERDAEVVFARTRALLDVPMQMLLALNGAFQAAPSALTVPDFDRMVQPWAKRALGMGSVGWIEMPTPPAGRIGAALPPRRQLPTRGSQACWAAQRDAGFGGVGAGAVPARPARHAPDGSAQPGEEPPRRRRCRWAAARTHGRASW